MRRLRKRKPSLPEKANKILNGILIALILIAIKVWHLAVVQHEKKIEESKKPQRRVIIERSERATINDCFGVPLAINKVQYNAAISYGPIRDLPRVCWKKNESGKRIKHSYRLEYINQLSQKLGEELNLDPEWIEDVIHSKAALLGNVPCILKQNISELEYYRLKMLEKDWPGVHAEIGSKRCYPLGPVGAEVIGYIGPISRQEYEAITHEMANLRDILTAYEEGESEANLVLQGYRSIEEVSERLEELEKKAYHINDFVGKTGVEAFFDESLRGLCGKHIYLSDTRGNFLRELPGSENPTPGTRMVLSISSELQAFAEQLLAEYENEPASAVPLVKRPFIPSHQPWIKGGAIAVMDPNNGALYALASFPTFDPNDFIRIGNDSESEGKNLRVSKWLETEQYLANIWNMKVPFTRPRLYDQPYEEEIEMTWENYLDFILPKESLVKKVLEKKNTLADALRVQLAIDRLIALFAEKNISLSGGKILDLIYCDSNSKATGLIITLPEKFSFEEQYEQVKDQVLELKQELAPYFDGLFSNYDKNLLVDLYRLIVDSSFSFLGELLGQMTLSEYRDASAHFVSVKDALQEIVKEIFMESDFKQWREEHFKDYLAEKREEEKESHKKFARPFIEYLEKARKELFQAFWKENQWVFLSFILSDQPIEQSNLYYHSLKTWRDELEAGAHQGLSWVKHYHALRRVTDQLDIHFLPSFLTTLRSFEQLDRPLIGKYVGLRGSKERDLAMAFYPLYGFGYARSHAFRQAATIGSLFKLVPAYEALKQRYLKLKDTGESLNPLTIIDDKHRVYGKNDLWNVGFTLDGKAIPQFYRGGRLPRTEHAGVGKVDLIRALEVSSNPYFAMLSGDILEDPEDLCEAANLLGFGEKTGVDLPGEYEGRLPSDITYNRTGLYAMSIGQHSLVGTPLQTAVMLALLANGGKVFKPQIVKERIHGEASERITQQVRWEVFLPPQIQNTLLTGMRQVVMGDKGTARLIRNQYDPTLIKQIIGKTSTSEVIERMSLDGANGQMKLKHVWFGAISYESNDFSKPELIVIVYLRYGGWGKEAAPLAVEIVKKWRALKKKHEGSIGIRFATE
jgi:cell division protein FtsI/penicillin-binding protein 2